MGGYTIVYFKRLELGVLYSVFFNHKNYQIQLKLKYIHDLVTNYDPVIVDEKFALTVPHSLIFSYIEFVRMITRSWPS